MNNIIILVIASRGDIYDKFIFEYWIPMIKYANKNYNNIKIFLLFGNGSKINDLEEIKNNIMVAEKYNETYKNILEKTLDAFDFCVNNYNFNYIFRTNLSSFIVLDKFIEMIEKLNKTDYAGGVNGVHKNIKFISGAGMLFSKDVIENMVINRQQIFNLMIDDVDIGRYLQNKYKYEHLNRYDIDTHNNLLSDRNLQIHLNNIINNDHYHIRLRNPNREIDIQVVKFLTNHYYKN
jgi:hypothetical protein